MKKILAILFVWLPLVCLAAIPDVTLYIDVTSPNPQKFSFSVRAGNTPVIVCKCVTNLTTGGAYTNFSTGWTPQLNYFLNDSASSGKTVSGTLASATGVITFTAITNSFPAQGNYFAEIYLYNGVTPKLTIGQGQLTVTRSPSSGSFGDLNLSPRINWDIVENIGTRPWLALTEPAFLASVAYNITAAMTNTWITDSTDEELLRTQFNAASNSFNTSIGTLTTNLATETSRATNAEIIISNSIVAAVAVETSRATNAELVISNTFNTAYTNQAITNAAFQALHTAQVSTNSWFQSLFSALANTNAGYQALFNAQALTNATFQTWFNFQISTNSWYQGLLTAQVNTNAGFQLLFSTQVNTNASLQGQITQNLTNQNSTNTVIQNQITSIGAGTNLTLRYFARTNASETVEVLANGSSITFSRTNATFYATIPANKHIYSMDLRVRGDYTSSGQIYLSMGTNDVNSSTVITAWVPGVNCYRESDGGNVVLTATPNFNPTYDGTIVISGMGTSAAETYHLHLTW